MSNGVIPQLFAIWRKSVLLTVGAISLGAERLESSLTRWGKPGDRPDRAPRVKVPVRAAKVVARRAPARAARKPVAAPAAPSRPTTSRPAAGARKLRVKAAPVPPVVEMAAPAAAPAEGQSAI